MRDHRTNTEPRWLVRRQASLRRWRVLVGLRVYRGLGLPVFEFEFRFGFPGRLRDDD